MRNSRILDMRTEEGVLKPIEFFTTGIYEYLIGWPSKTVTTMMKKDMFPRTPYLQVVQKLRQDLELHLYTEEMVKEAVQLIEDSYPPVYRGSNAVLKEAYQKDIREYKVKVKQLEQMWNTKDYIATAPAKPQPIRRKRKVVTE